MTIILAGRTVAVILVIATDIAVTIYTYRRTYGQHGQPLFGPLHPIFVRNVPTCSKVGESSVLVARTEVGTTVNTYACIQIILALVRIVSLEIEALSAPCTITGTCTSQHAVRCWICDTVRQIPFAYILTVTVTCVHFKTCQTAQTVILVLECTVETQVVAR